ncbi:unnamed protein product [Oikopleura dioica]|uniref:Uncharacterized protein n=1 Tax=Oikopleura dioica TaxID=34765 RepID=E4XD19_OIKDI|nr:unnamed protein product [Oikopleura dioica]
MNEKKDLAIELFNLYEKNVNEPNRKKVLDGMLNHPSGHILAQCVFDRVDSSVFKLISKSEKVENGTYDSILDPAYCKRILRKFGYNDYVITFLKDGFKREHGRDPGSLSEIVKIIKEREEIKNQTATPKFVATFQENLEDLLDVRIGSEWIISEVAINGQPRVSTYHRRSEFMQKPYVYKICRSKPRVTRSTCIQLRQVHLKAPSDVIIEHETLLLEPFFITTHFSDTIEVYNLLDPQAAPMIIKRVSLKWIHLPSMENSGMNLYENDFRINGQLPESVLFLLNYQPNETTVRLECVEIKPSSINTLWIENIEINVPHVYNSVFWINRDNYIVRILDKETGRSQIYHVLLSQAKIVKYQHNHEFSLFPSDSYAIFEEKLVMISARATDVSMDRRFGFLSSEKEDNFKPVCFIESNVFDQHFINKEEIICARETDQSQVKIKRISIRKLLDFIDNEDQEKKIVHVKELTLPCIDLYDARITKVQEEETVVMGCSKIGRVLRERVGNLWQDKLHDCEKNGFASNRSWKAFLLAGSGVYDGREVGAAKMSPTGLSKDLTVLWTQQSRQKITAFHSGKKPLAFCCIAPHLAPKFIPRWSMIL